VTANDIPATPASGSFAPVENRPPADPGNPTAPTADNGTFDAYRSLVRLLVGGTLELSRALFEQLKTWETAHPDQPGQAISPSSETIGEQARFALIGLLFSSAESARRGAQRIGQTSVRIGGAWLGLMPPLRWGLQRWVTNHEADLERWISIGRSESNRSRSLARGLLGGTIDQVVSYLGGSNQVDSLVQTLAGDYLQYLQAHPEEAEGLVQALAGSYLTHLEQHPEVVAPLINSQADDYIDRLQENPEKVQTLIQGQSTGLAAELLEEVRERTVSADNVIEMLVRSILKRSARQELPEPPYQVQQRAERAILPSDYKTRQEE
jgi:hypothetical protein